MGGGGRKTVGEMTPKRELYADEKIMQFIETEQEQQITLSKAGRKSITINARINELGK